MNVDYQVNPVKASSQTKKILRDFVENDLYIALPAKVYGVDNYESMQVVTVKPCIDLIYPEYNDTVLLSNTMKKVFVKIPSGGGFSVKLPIAVGDLVTLHWSHKDLGDFLDGSGDDVEISKEAVANLEDCWVTHGFGTRKSHQNPSQTDMIIEGPATTITITPEGKVTIKTDGDSELTSASHSITATTSITGKTDITGATTVTGDTTINGNSTTTGIATSTSVVTGVVGCTGMTMAGTAGASGTFANSVTVVNGIVVAGS